MLSLKIMQTTRNQEETLTASKNTDRYLAFSLFFFPTLTKLSLITQAMRRHASLIFIHFKTPCVRDITCSFFTAQGVCRERGGCWCPGIFQRYAGDTTSVQI